MKKPRDENTSQPDSPASRDGEEQEATPMNQRDASTAEKAPTPGAVSKESEARRWKKGLGGKFQRFMTAAAFAESGETDTALEIAYEPHKATKVLLAIGGTDVSNDAVHYAANLCIRMDAALDVLLVERQMASAGKLTKGNAPVSSEDIQRRIQQLSGNRVPVRVFVVFGEVAKEVYGYAKNHKDVAVIVFDSGHSWKKEPERAKWEAVLQRLSKKLAIPTITAVPKSPVGG